MRFTCGCVTCRSGAGLILPLLQIPTAKVRAFFPNSDDFDFTDTVQTLTAKTEISPGRQF